MEAPQATQIVRECCNAGGTSAIAAPVATATPTATASSTAMATSEDNTQQQMHDSDKKSVSSLLPSTLLYDEVPVLFQEPHVRTGFRRLHQPWSYYFLSIFQCHNESMNVWTHLLACLLHFNKLLTVQAHVDFVHDPYTWPLLAGLVCGMILYGCSAVAHCLQSRSELVHYTAFMFDYSGIGIYGLGSIILHIAYCSEDSFYYAVQPWFVPAGCILGFAISFCCTVAKVIYRRPYPPIKKVWQMTPVFLIYILIIAPIVHRLFACWIYDTDCNDSIPCHVRQMAWFLVSGFWFAIDIPQRWLPGKCDVFFHSHQLFHIAITICTLYQMEGAFIDFQTRKEMLLSRPCPTLLSAFGPVVCVVMAQLFSILTFHRRIKGKLAGRDLRWLDGVGMGFDGSCCGNGEIQPSIEEKKIL